MFESITLAIKDFFDRKILLISLIPLIISAILWGLLFFIFHTPIDAMLNWILNHIPFLNAKWIRDAIETIGGILLYYELIIITSVMFVGIITDMVVDRINEKYYHLPKKGFGTLTGSIIVSLKYNIIFIMLLILFLPAMFVPGLNIIVHLFLWVILIKEPLFYDSIAMYADRKSYRLLKKRYRKEILILSIILASLLFIPFLGIFVYIFQLLIFAHFNLKRLKEQTLNIKG